MTAAQYQAWQRGGGQWQPAAPVADLSATLRRHGYTVYVLGDASHMNAGTPEDHTPFSATGWPNPSPYGWVFALDIMPAGSALPSLASLGAQILADKVSGDPGAAAVKYMNWSPQGASCRHDSWEPGHVTSASSDVGHIHLSMRSDYRVNRSMATYDPVARLRGGSVPVVVEAAATVGGVPAFPGRVLTYTPGRPMMHGTDVTQAQNRLISRGWHLTADGWYGAQSAGVVRQFQADSNAHNWPLSVDGALGPRTWDALWRRPIS